MAALTLRTSPAFRNFLEKRPRLAILQAAIPSPSMRIYLAGPLFTAAERSFNRRLRDLLEKKYGHEVWLPQEHEPRARGAMDIFKMDVSGLDSSDVVVANMDGPDPDSGTCWECGYAYKKKPIIVYRTDFRSSGDTKTTPYNLMLTESADVRLHLPFGDEEKAAAAIHKALSKLKTRRAITA